MQESSNSEKFTFGEVADTEYFSYEIVDTQTKLPYHPFLFDLKLTIFKSKPNYEEPDTQYTLSREKSIIFGRKKKNQKEWNSSSSLPIYLNAQTISERHFSINQRYILKDENSKHGTFFWIDRSHPKKLYPNHFFLINKQPLIITKIIHLPKPIIQLVFQNSLTRITDQKKLYLIGSHQKCDLIIPELYHFEVCINISTFTIFTHLDQQQACAQHGLWYRLRNDKAEEIPLQHGNLILVDPYIFRITS